MSDVLTIPWPPSANRYWRHVGYKVLISKEARKYKQTIKDLSFTWKRKTLTGRISVSIKAFPPDNRKRDLDNILKVTIDSLQEAALFINDSQIDEIFIERMPVEKGGKIMLSLSELYQ